MPMSTDIQNKVLKIAANKAVVVKAKLGIKNKFYDLKKDEIAIEEMQEDFNAKVLEFDNYLNSVLEQLKTVPEEPKVVEEPAEELYEDTEEVIVPQKPIGKAKGGIQVRMQEEVDTSVEDDTDFEVPFEAEEK